MSSYAYSHISVNETKHRYLEKYYAQTIAVEFETLQTREKKRLRRQIRRICDGKRRNLKTNLDQLKAKLKGILANHGKSYSLISILSDLQLAQHLYLDTEIESLCSRLPLPFLPNLSDMNKKPMRLPS